MQTQKYHFRNISVKIINSQTYSLQPIACSFQFILSEMGYETLSTFAFMFLLSHIQYKIMKEEESPMQSPNQFPSGFSLPALQVPNKHYSLEADMATGWHPNKMKVVGPVPLNFDATICDFVTEVLTSFGRRHPQRVVYLGPRYSSSFKLHQEMRRDYSYKYDAVINTNFPHLAAYFRKFYSHFKPKHSRPFKGMNPTVKPGQSAIFDGGFESANLDAVIKVHNNQYDLFLRVDSNTRGHLQWFNFTVRGGGSKKIKINIVNCRRGRTLYNYSMKPFFWSSIKRGPWRQGGLNVKYQQKPLRFSFLKQEFSEQRLVYNCLSFEYIFDDEDQTVQFAYCAPFTYSDNCKMIQSLHNASDSFQAPILKEEVAGQTLGGLQIPLLTITDPDTPDAFKTCIFVSARIHPGQTCGSYMVKGFLQFLVSTDEIATELRKQIIFKVIPMANPDGVVVGNYRTSLCGRDLNRMFRSSQSLLIPQVATIKSTVKKLKDQYKNRLLFFLDFHGHSVRKNVFIYGPEYQIWQTNYYRTRMLPKLISQRTEMFRYYSCMFRISSQKKTTARAVLLKHIPHCYTVEASVASYYSPTEHRDYDFAPTSWQQMGLLVAKSMSDYFSLIDNSKTQKARDKDKVDKKEGSLPKVRISASKTRRKFSQQSKELDSTRKTNRQQVRKSQVERMDDIQKQLFENNSDGVLSDRAKDLIQDIKKADKQLKHNQDHYSEGGSDSEDSGDDLSEKQLTSFHKNIILSIKEFKDRFYRRDSKPKQLAQSSTQMPHKKLEMIASLRKKNEQVSLGRSELASQRKSNSPNSPVGARFWLRGKASGRSSSYQVCQSQSFHVYVTKLRMQHQEGQEYQGSYSGARRKLPFN